MTCVIRARCVHASLYEYVFPIQTQFHPTHFVTESLTHSLSDFNCVF